MRGIAAVIVTGFVAMLLFGVFAPAVLEPIAEFVVNDPVVANYDAIDAAGFQEDLFQSIFVWGPLFVLGASVVFAVRWYLRRERLTGRRVR